MFAVPQPKATKTFNSSGSRFLTKSPTKTTGRFFSCFLFSQNLLKNGKKGLKYSQNMALGNTSQKTLTKLQNLA